MTQAIWLRRAIATLALTATFTTLALAPKAGASPLPRLHSISSPRPAPVVCAVDWRKGPYFVKQLIRCAARHYDVSVTKALAIADRESHYSPRAYNSWSCAKGVYQHLCTYWPSRATTYGFHDWPAFNARANIMVTMRMVRRGGWGPWGG